MRLLARLTVLCLLAAVAGCAVNQPIGSPPERGSPRTPVPPATRVERPVVAPAPPPMTPATPALTPIIAAGDLPCVPTTHGCISTNPDVTATTLEQALCVPGYTKTVRPYTPAPRK